VRVGIFSRGKCGKCLTVCGIVETSKVRQSTKTSRERKASSLVYFLVHFSRVLSFLFTLIYKSQELFSELPKLGDGESAVNKQIYAYSLDLWGLKKF